MASYTNSCPCNEKYEGNCAHYLSNWMIKNGKLSTNPKGAYCCKEGRPIRAKEMRDVFVNCLKLKRKFNPPKDRNDNVINCYIYCEKTENPNKGQGHVYYGKKNNCVAGTGSADGFDMKYVEYYY